MTNTPPSHKSNIVESKSSDFKNFISNPFVQGLISAVGLLSSIFVGSPIIKILGVLIVCWGLFALRGWIWVQVKSLANWLTWKFVLGVVLGTFISFGLLFGPLHPPVINPTILPPGTVTQSGVPHATSSLHPTETISTPTLTSIPFEIPTNTIIPLPTSTTNPQYASGLSNDCVEAGIWSPYEDDIYLHVNDHSIDHGCWNINNWGYYAKQNSLSIEKSTVGESGQQHGIYRSIGDNVIIKFKVQAKGFGLSPNSSSSGFIEIAIIDINKTKPGLDFSKSLRYIYNPNEKNSKDQLIPTIYQDRNRTDRLNSRINISDFQQESLAQEIRIEIQKPKVTFIIVKDTDEYAFSNVDYEGYGLWLGYSLPGEASMRVDITDFELLENPR